MPSKGQSKTVGKTSSAQAYRATRNPMKRQREMLVELNAALKALGKETTDEDTVRAIVQLAKILDANEKPEEPSRSSQFVQQLRKKALSGSAGETLKRLKGTAGETLSGSHHEPHARKFVRAFVDGLGDMVDVFPDTDLELEHRNVRVHERKKQTGMKGKRGKSSLRSGNVEPIIPRGAAGRIITSGESGDI